MLDFSKANEWTITEPEFDATALGKAEANFCLGNGYLGLRSATEEHYPGETRDLLVAGTFDRFSPEEVTELPNAPDVTNIELELNGERFDLTQGTILHYARELNLRTGLLSRRVVWISPEGRRYHLLFERVVSLSRQHHFALRISVTPKMRTELRIRSGIDGRMTNDGTQHFTEGKTRFIEKEIQEYTTRTIQSDITFIVEAMHRFGLDDAAVTPDSEINILRRRMYSEFYVDVGAGETFVCEKHAAVYTSRDAGVKGYTCEQLQQTARFALYDAAALGFDAFRLESSDFWQTRVWDRVPILIDGPELDQLVIRFAQYHMQIMTPAHDSRMNIGAKGLTGEGYKGHTFWDTEIFLLPYFTFSMPEIARRLEEYRYHSLPGAHEKAAHNGFEGAQFPWESAWLSDGEVTPEYMGTDIVTGRPIKVWSGVIEIHITADVAFGVWQYYHCTGDQDFMDRYGYELIFDCAKFWHSRLELGADDLLHINDVVGPDEYKEHVDDNAFTNYMARWNIRKAMEYAEDLRINRPVLYAELNAKLHLNALLPEWKQDVESLYVPLPNKNHVLPQDATYLTLQNIDLTRYRQQKHVGEIYKDFNQDQITKIQVSKQADVMALFLLLENEFTRTVKEASWNYYEPRTLHDSSLSLSTHSVLACDIGDPELGYLMFQKACKIDLSNDDLHSSDAGIHAASYGGIWQCVTYGFGGLRMVGEKLRIAPRLPAAWRKLSYTFQWRGQKIAVTVTRGSVRLENLTGTEPVEVEVNGKLCKLEGKASIYRNDL